MKYGIFLSDKYFVDASMRYNSEYQYLVTYRWQGLQTHTPVSLEDILYCHIHVCLRGHLISRQLLVHFKCRDGPYVVFFKHRTVPSGESGVYLNLLELSLPQGILLVYQ